MKKVYIYALAAFAVFAITAATGAFASDQCYTPPGSCKPVCTSCPAPAWDRTPIYIQQPNNPYLPPTCPTQAWLVDPWVRCGAFCAAGQTPVGWPYGWGAQYWLRPDSNF